MCALFEEVDPVILVGIGHRSVLVEQPVDPLGQHVTQLLVPGPFRSSKRIIRMLDDLAGNRGGLYPFVAIQQEKPVVVVDVRKERVAPPYIDGERSAADE